jgi:carboxyl-terminal processing protease
MENQPKSRLVQIIIIAAMLGGVFFAGYKIGLGRKAAPDATAILENKAASAENKVDFRPFWKVWNLLDEKFVAVAATSSESATTTAKQKVWGAISGLTDSLGDPYTVFMPPENAKLFENEISGSFEGIGMEIADKDNFLTVVAPLKGTPAEKAGIMPGDRILKIDDTLTANLRADQAVRSIRGPKGTTVRLLIERAGKKAPFEIKVIRDTIAVPTVETELKTAAGAVSSAGEGVGLGGENIFVIKLYTFTASSGDLFRQALRKFVESGSDKLIIDLRGNPGGYLEAAVDMASWFLPAGKIVVRENFGKNEPEIVYRSRGYDVFNGNLKMVILVNGGSASASEILAGALQEYGIAKLVGTQTFGKGSVQELLEITPDTSLKVTVARWLTPHGRSISAGGLTPDIVIQSKPGDSANGNDVQMARAIEILDKGL